MKVSLMQCFLVSLVLAVLGFVITQQVSFEGQAPTMVALSLLISGIVTIFAITQYTMTLEM